MSEEEFPSSPNHWQELQEVFADAVALAGKRREEFVDQVVARNTSLGEELRSLLAHHEEDLPQLLTLESPPMPVQLGPYRILEELGRGGMGTVYLAERADGEFEGKVAIKVVRRDLGGAEARRRFLRERQLLADLDHPQIASLLDAGTSEEGEPWLVMDYVEGLPIDRYCDSNKLSLAARIELFCKVCGAVHFAHQSLVVHRDLKPSNILVRSDGSPILLDFGIAKLVDEEAGGVTGLTRQGASPRTPEYASPEQISSRVITTASDVYALGTILYEMLVGERPHLGEGRGLEQQICDQDPVVPSVRLARLQGNLRGLSPATITPRQLRGDLDEILLRALRKEPTQRYVSAAELAEDLGNFLRGLPVKARRGALFYRTSKFVRRHWMGVVTGLLIVALLAAVVITRLSQSRQLAQEAEKVQAMNTFLQEMMGSADPYEGLGRSTTLAEALLAAAERIDDSFAEQPELAANAKHTVGTIFTRLGNYWEAEPLLTEALAMRRQLDPRPNLEKVETANRLAQLFVELGRTEEAEPLVEEALTMLDQLPHREARNLTDSLSTRAWLEQFQGNLETAEILYRQVLDIRLEGLGAEDPAIALALNDLALVLADQGRFDDAERLFEDSLDLRRRTLGDEHPAVAESLNAMGLLYEEQGDRPHATKLYKQALVLQEKTLGEGHPAVARTLNNLAGALSSQGDYEGAKERFEAALAIRRQALGDHHPDVGTSLDALGTVLANQGDYQDAERYLTEALRVFEQSVGSEHVETAKALNNMGYVKIESGSYGEAVPFLERALEIYRQRWGEEHKQVATSLSNLAQVWYRLGQVRAAAEALDEVLTIERRIYGDAHPDVVISLINLGAVLSDLGEYGEAEGLLVEALETLRKIQEEDSPLEGPALNALAGVYEETERWQEARSTYQQAVEAARRVSGADHPVVATNLSNLANLEVKLGELEKAERLYFEALQIFQANPDFVGPQPAMLFMKLGELLCGLAGRSDEGLEFFRSARGTAEVAVGGDHWLMGEIDSAHGVCLASLGNRAAAEPLLLRGLERLQETLGEEHPQTEKAAQRWQRFEVARAGT